MYCPLALATLDDEIREVTRLEKPIWGGLTHQDPEHIWSSDVPQVRILLAQVGNCARALVGFDLLSLRRSHVVWIFKGGWSVGAVWGQNTSLKFQGS